MNIIPTALCELNEKLEAFDKIKQPLKVVVHRAIPRYPKAGMAYFFRGYVKVKTNVIDPGVGDIPCCLAYYDWDENMSALRFSGYCYEGDNKDDRVNFIENGTTDGSNECTVVLILKSGPFSLANIKVYHYTYEDLSDANFNTYCSSLKVMRGKIVNIDNPLERLGLTSGNKQVNVNDISENICLVRWYKRKRKNRKLAKIKKPAQSRQQEITYERLNGRLHLRSFSSSGRGCAYTIVRGHKSVIAPIVISKYFNRNRHNIETGVTAQQSIIRTGM